MKRFVLAPAILLAVTALAHADAAAKTPTAKAAACAEALKARVGAFELWLDYLGPEDKPYYRLHLASAKPMVLGKEVPGLLPAKVTGDEIKKIIDHLAAEGFLDRAARGVPPKKPADGPSYRLRIMTNAGPDGALLRGFWQFREDLGWGLPMLKRLDSLRSVLTGDAAKQMDVLLQRLSGHRKEWEKQPAPVGVKPKQ